MTFDDLVFDRPSVFGELFYALAFFDNGLGVHVHPTYPIREGEDLYEVSVVKGSTGYWVVATSVNIFDMGIRELPLSAEEVTAVMARVAAL